MTPSTSAAERLLSEAFALIDRKRIPEAEAKAQAALAQGARADAAHHALGLCALAREQVLTACEWFAEAARLAPGAAEHVVMLGVALGHAKKPAEAEAAFKKALSLLPPGHPARHDATVNLAVALYEQNKRPEALAVLMPIREPEYGATANRILRRIADDADDVGDLETTIAALVPLSERPGAAPDVSNRRALLLLRTGRWSEAEAAFRKALALDPDFVPALINLGAILKDVGRLTESEALLRRAIALAPTSANAHANLGGTLTEAGRIDEAVASIREALACDPSLADIESNLCLVLNYTERPNDEIFAAHRAWNAHHGAKGAAPPRGPHPAKRPLRVGVVGWDFTEHGGCFVEPLLANLDRSRIESVCYSDTARPDGATERMTAAAALWRDSRHASDAALAEHIRADGIDVLIDLAGHSGGNRLTLFATKPAPVAATWLGYPNTTGLTAIDGRVTDAWADPGGAEAHNSEALLRLPSGFLCYRPPVGAPAPAAPPSERLGIVSFGNFNTLPKLSASTIRLWSRLLREVPRSRLVLKGMQLKDDGVRARVLGEFKGHGVDPDRVALLGFIPGDHGHLAAYGEIDIALDPFPYNGTTITCEALWMGVPVMTLAGARHAARVGVSLLARAGLSEMIADSEDAFIATAAALAENEAKRRALRSGMRDRLAASPLCDETAFADSFATALEGLWARG